MHWHWTSRGVVGGLAAFSQRPGSSREGAEAGRLQSTPRSSWDVVSKAMGVCCWGVVSKATRQLLERNAIPKSFCLGAEQKSHQLPGESSLIKVAPWSSLGGLLIKAGISLTLLRKLLVSFEGCSYGSKGFGSRSGMVRAARGWGWVHEESAQSRKGAGDFSPLSAETGAASEQIFPL